VRSAERAPEPGDREQVGDRGDRADDQVGAADGGLDQMRQPQVQAVEADLDEEVHRDQAPHHAAAEHAAVSGEPGCFGVLAGQRGLDVLPLVPAHPGGLGRAVGDQPPPQRRGDQEREDALGEDSVRQSPQVRIQPDSGAVMIEEMAMFIIQNP
jgi:hypothetical protein